MPINKGNRAGDLDAPAPTRQPPEAALVAWDAEAVRTSAGIVSQATPADLARRTPCAGWLLGDLLAHMTAQHRGFTAAAEGQTSLTPWQVRSEDEPVEAYRSAAAHVREVFARPGILERRFFLPEIAADRTFPATRAIGFHFLDYVVHSWDVAKALGTTVQFAPDLLDAALTIAKAVPGGSARLAPRAAFAPALPWRGGSQLDTILALLGRSPTWPHTW